MLHRLRPRLTYANVVATLALFAAVGGGAYASSLVGKGGKIKSCVARTNGRLRVVKPNKTCHRGRERTLSWNQLGPSGPPGRSALTPLRHAETERGVWGTYADVTSGSHLLVSAETFPIPLRAGLDSSHVVYVSSASATHCPGVGRAESGYLCVYQTGGENFSFAQIDKATTGYSPSGATGTDASGFTVFLYTADQGSSGAVGTWAVTG